jgi:DNA-binding response OmpR family regulator
MVVEDEAHLRELIRRYLERAGYSVLSTESGAQALEWVERGAPDLAVLDLGLPDVPGEEVLAEAHERHVPVVVLTARAAVEDRISGLRQGADDYVTKPFSPQELVLRVGAVLSRTRAEGAGTKDSFGAGLLVLDHARHEASAPGLPLPLTPTEWSLLSALSGAPGRMFSRYELINHTHGYEYTGYERTIDSHIRNLRHKLGEDPARPTIIETVHGFGYRLGLRRDT